MSKYAIEIQETMTYHQDGLLDMFIGFSLLAFGIGILTGNTWLSGVLPASLLPIWLSIRKSFLQSRVRAEDVRSTGGNRRLVALSGLFTLTFLAGVGAFVTVLLIPDWIHALPIDLLLGLGGAILLGIVGLILSARRLYAYALLAVIIFAISYLFDGPLWLSVVALSGIMTLTGLVALVRFSSGHPKIG